MKGLTRAFLLTLVAASAVGAAGDPQAPPPVPKRAPADDIEDFVPSERVKADDAVAFPTDI